jgi:hypothetical protein
MLPASINLTTVIVTPFPHVLISTTLSIPSSARFLRASVTKGARASPSTPELATTLP